MNGYLFASLVLITVGLAPAVALGSRGSAADRLIGLELTSAVAVVALLLLSQADEQSMFVIVPLVLATLSLAGVLVFTRLLGPRR